MTMIAKMMSFSGKSYDSELNEIILRVLAAHETNQDSRCA